MKKSLAHSLPPVTKILKLANHEGMKILASGQKDSHLHNVSPEGRIAIATTGKIEMLEMADILYIKAESNYVRLFVKGASPYLMAKTLKKISASLLSAGFIRVHQTYMVHPSVIKSYYSKGSYLILHNGDQLPVSRANRKEVIDRLMFWSC
jgi:two-component system LytT family response regulator